ncbi:MAG: hypothetical protein P8177_03840 [Gemmatimonadota bacterium]|jgi:hypothetical protein
MRCILAGMVLLTALQAAAPAAAQRADPLSRIRSLDVDRVDVGRVTVLYSAHDGEQGPETAAVLEAAAPLRDAADFFAERLGGDFRLTLALLSPRDWGRVGGAVHALPWHSQPDRLVVLPVRADLGLMLSGPDSTRARRVLEVVSLHQLGHVVTAAYYYPGGFREPDPPVRWFDELMASYLSYAYLQEHDPDLAEFMIDLAWDVTRTTEPRFSTLGQYDAFHSSFLSAPQGANTKGWYHNAFNLRAAELYRKHGDGLMDSLRTELPWDRVESWTTEELLELLEPISRGFLAWSEEMASATRRRY